MINEIRINIRQNECDGVYLRWWFNGWHYYNFTNKLEINMQTTVGDIMTTNVFSRISRIERPVKTETEYSYTIALDGIAVDAIDGFANILIAERVEQYEDGAWREIEITRGEKPIRVENSPAWSMEFEITRKELPNTPAVFQQSQFFWIGDTLAELDDGEVIALTKQVNNIAELQDRQTDFTASFKIRKTRAMRALFELSGDPQSNTNFPYIEQPCRLVQNGIELITNGRMALLKSDADYYHVSVYSGNMNFFTESGKSKINELVLADVNHAWNYLNVYGSQIGELNYLYPLIEPSDDGGYLPIEGGNGGVTIGADKIWPHIKIRAIWDTIFTRLGFTSSGKHIASTTFNSLWMPIVNRNAGDVSKYLFSSYNNTFIAWPNNEHNSIGANIGTVVINGSTDTWWANYSIYVAKFTGTHKFRIYAIWQRIPPGDPAHFYMWNRSEYIAMTLSESETGANYRQISVFTGELDMTAGQSVSFHVNKVRTYYFDISVTAIENPLIGYGSDVTPMMNLPQITQSDFIKMICNMFALVPECNPRTRNIHFWSFNELYENIPIARDWSNYLSETNDETEFKFGDYAQRNFMRYKESDDVIPDNGTGMMQINDVNLKEEQDMIKIPVSYSDEVLVMNGINVSRINMNIYDAKLDQYNMNEKIDPRIVYAKTVTGKILHIREIGGFENVLDVNNPKCGSSIETSFGSLGANYAPLANMLYHATLRRLKFNLPVYEVAALQHNVPVYLRQYASYFYVNKINNFVAGKLCTVDLIKL